MTSLVEIGYVARPHGVRGELRVVTHDPDSDVLGGVDEVHIGGRRCRVRAARRAADAWLVAVDEVRDRDAAAALRGQPVSVSRDAIEVDEGGVLLADLVGCAAVLPDGTPWGEIVGIEVGAQDRLVIHDGQVERLLPVADPLIVEVDVDARRVVVSPPEGLPEYPLARPPRAGDGPDGPARNARNARNDRDDG